VKLDASPVVIGVGACTPVGMHAAASAAAIRAGVSSFCQHPFMVDSSGKRMVVAAAPYLDAQSNGDQRLADLAALAVAESLAGIVDAGLGGASLPIFVGLPANRGGVRPDADLVRRRVTQEMSAAGVRARDVALFEAGHAGGAMALEAAWQAVSTGAAPIALAGGVDTYLEPAVLEWLDDCDQLHSSGEENNPYGFIPGEGAGFVLLASQSAAMQMGLDSMLSLRAAASTHESNLIKTEDPCIGEGMCKLVRMLASTLPVGERFDEIYIDINGEPYRSDEFGFATVRTNVHFADTSGFMAPADCWGDVGAASGPLYLILAEASARRGYARGRNVVVLTSSEAGQRCGVACRFQAVGGAR
jgi:3-oxoacyl-[acyl-carrier-protein] synthase I